MDHTINKNLQIPTVEHSRLEALISKIKNTYDMMSPQFHKVLLDTWNDLGQPDLMQINFIFGPIIFIANPTMADSITRMKGVPVVKSPWIEALVTGNGPVAKYGIFGLMDEKEYEGGITYMDVQPHVMQAFNTKALRGYSAIMTQDAVEIARQLPQGKFDLVPYIDRMVLNSATRALMSFVFESDEEAHQLTRFLREGPKSASMKALVPPQVFGLLQVLSKFSSFVPSEEAYLKDREWFYTEIVNKIMQTKNELFIQNPDRVPEDMLDYLIIAMKRAQKEELEKATDPEGRLKFTDYNVSKIIESETATFLLAGQETSASQEVSTFAYILSNPEIFNKLKLELKSILGNRLPTYDDLEKLIYLEAVLNDVLTKYPNTFIIPRYSNADFDLGGYSIPGNTHIFATPLLVHRKLIPDLDKLGPEIFLDPEKKALFYHQIISFGKGRRACLGERFARMEIMLHIATLLQLINFKFINQGKDESGIIPLRSAKSLEVEVINSNASLES